MVPKISVFVKLQGDYSHAPRISGRVIDYPTGKKIDLELDGKLYTRTIYVRGVYRNMFPVKPLYEFVIIDGNRYAITRYRWQDSCFDEKLEYLA